MGLMGKLLKAQGFGGTTLSKLYAHKRSRAFRYLVVPVLVCVYVVGWVLYWLGLG